MLCKLISEILFVFRKKKTYDIELYKNPNKRTQTQCKK